MMFSSRRLGSKRTLVFLLCGGCLLLVHGMTTARADSSDPIDLAAATLVLPAGMTGPEKAAAEMLGEEVEQRCYLHWTTTDHLPAAGTPAVVLGERSALLHDFPALSGSLPGEESDKPEGYRIVSSPSKLVVVAGNDARGVLFGAGRLLRLMNFSREGVSVAPDVNLVTAPRYPIRGHELCYRPKTNTYDAWTPAMYEQYIRDLIIYGTNAIEMAPYWSDDAPQSPHFSLSPIEMDVAVSRIAQKYGLDFWMWYPTFDAREFNGKLKDYSDPATVQAALKEWGDVLRQLPRLDAVYIPGGDPGKAPPKYLFPFLEKMAADLHTFQPKAQVWISPQDFNREETDDFYRLLAAQPDWLTGIVDGPWDCDDLATLRARVPQRYLLRDVPDITHTFRCEYPVTDWDTAYSTTEHREPINPRPVDYAAIFHRVLPIADRGFITYSEGVNDDVNKILWSSLGWDPDESVTDILRDYGHYFIGSGHGNAFAQGLLDLERDWRGPVARNDQVYATLAEFQELERTATPEMLHNWRFEQGLYRAYYDATEKARLAVETAQEENAVKALREASSTGSLAAVARAEKALTDSLPSPTPPGTDWQAWRARVFELAEALFQTIHMQLSVPRYQAESPERGANLDLIDHPLNDAPWMEDRFQEVKALANETERRERIGEIVDWCDRGPVMQGPLHMVFRGLDKTIPYKLQILYGSVDNDLSHDPMKVELVANGTYEIHSMQDPRLGLPTGAGEVTGGGKTGRIGSGPVLFDVPAAATATGELRLTWTPSRAPVDSGGLQVKGVWLIGQTRPNMILSPWVNRSPYPQ